MNENNQRKILILTVLTIIFTIAGSTLAYWSWQSTNEQRTLVSFTAPAGMTCSADGGGNITSNDKMIMPTSCTDPERAIQRTITLNTTSEISSNDIFIDLWLDVINIDTNLTNSTNFKYALTKTPNDCTTDAVEGSFNGITTGGRVNLLKNKEYIGTNQDTYYLYIWLDAAETSTSTMNQSFELSLGGKCEDELPEPEPSEPVLDETGMIPVTIDSSVNITTGSNVTTISKESSEWYSYEDKQWANAILVKEESRSKYLNTTGVTVDLADVLAYYVWIPRYSYKMNSSQGTGNESEISISWNYNETGYTPHPAFTFSEGMTGFWVGKFETTGEPTKPTILNGVSPLESQVISAQFTSSLLFANGTFDDTNRTITFADSLTYGLSNTTDSHMMKNSEWGAVAYLSHSKYGTCTDGTCQEVRYNNYNNSGLQTGCGAATPETTSESTTCTLAYGSGISEYPQSTTGNITGVFDMAGGAYEYVMGNYNNTKGSYWRLSNLPPTKYYDVYTTEAACTTETCGGNALTETKRWYGDSAAFVGSNGLWFRRGGNYNAGASAGVWNFVRFNGLSDSGISWRSVLSTQ